MAASVPDPIAERAAAAVLSPYSVKLPVFEGPLDLLLHLIKVNEVEITDIPIARIGEQYLQYLDLMRELDLEIVGEYLLMAATLAWIKSRMLLPPDPDATAEEEVDPRAELARQLLEHQRFKQAAETLQAMEARRSLVWTRDVIPEEFETSVEIFARVLQHYLIPRERIEACVAEIRKEGYEILRGDVGRPLGVERFLSGASLEVVEVEPGSAIAGQTIAEAALRADAGVTVLGVRRAGTFRPNPGAADRFEAGDSVLLLGDPDLLAAAACRFRAGD